MLSSFQIIDSQFALNRLKDGQPLDPSPRHKMDLESTGILRLVIRDVEPGDYGQYSVTISNNHGSATSNAKLLPDSKETMLQFLTPQKLLLLVLGTMATLAFLITLMLPPEFHCTPEGALGDVGEFLYQCTASCKCGETEK